MSGRDWQEELVDLLVLTCLWQQFCMDTGVPREKRQDPALKSVFVVAADVVVIDTVVDDPSVMPWHVVPTGYFDEEDKAL